MKHAVLYVCHGSRVPKAREEAVDFIKKVRPRINAPIQEVCFLELAEPSISSAFESCVSQGATQIAVVPLLLLTAAHAKKDIPEEINEVSSKYPHINVTYGRPIGVDDRLAMMLMDKINEKAKVDHHTVAVLVGRGSSDPDVVRDLTEISTILQKESPLREVKTCYLTAAMPKFTETIDELYNSNEQKIIVIPYLIFTGLLKKEIDETIEKYHWGNRHIEVCSYLGPHPILLDLFSERVHEALLNKNDLFSFHNRMPGQ